MGSLGAVRSCQRVRTGWIPADRYFATNICTLRQPPRFQPGGEQSSAPRPHWHCGPGLAVVVLGVFAWCKLPALTSAQAGMTTMGPAAVMQTSACFSPPFRAGRQLGAAAQPAALPAPTRKDKRGVALAAGDRRTARGVPPATGDAGAGIPIS